MSDFYTRSGDDGFTGLLGEERVPKNHPRAETLGTIDEATAALGLARANCKVEDNAAFLLTVQRDLYNMMAEIAATPENASRFRVIDASRVTALEEQISSIGQNVDTPREFIIPGDSQGSATLALARTIVRRAERRVAGLLHEKQIDNPALLHYLNRLSSLCFVLELSENQAAGKVQPTLAKE
jgi:cob(I)alamin adenosyltransferase